MRRIALLSLAVAACMASPPPAFAETAPATHATAVATCPVVSVAAPHQTASAVPAWQATITSIDASQTIDTRQRSNGRDALVFSVVGMVMIGALRTVSADKDGYPQGPTVRQQLNLVIAWLYYSSRNAMISTTTATFPGIAIATDTTKVKSANNTVLLNAGAVNAFAAADNAWTLTGGVLAASMFRKYLLLADANDVCTVLASSDAAAAASCVLPALPADGKAVVGSILVGTDGSHTFTPGTTALGAAGITTTYFDGFGDDAVFPFAQVTP